MMKSTTGKDTLFCFTLLISVDDLNIWKQTYKTRLFVFFGEQFYFVQGETTYYDEIKSFNKKI